MTGRLIFSTIGVPRAEDECGALLSGKENEESQKQEESREKHHGKLRLAVSLR